MALMFKLRHPVPSSSLLPEGRALRSIQAPQHVEDDDGVCRISSAAFRLGTDQTVSIDLEQLLGADDLKSDALYPSLVRSVGLVAIGVDLLRSEGVAVDHLPVPTNWYHGSLSGDSLKNSGRRRRLAKACTLVVPIDRDAVAAWAQASSN
jgi:hypothetical protein